MFARNVSIRLKPNSLPEFSTMLEQNIVPMLRQQPGFRDEIALVSEDSTDIAAISLWDSKEQADAYNTTSYPGVLKLMEKFVEGMPKVRESNVIGSSMQSRVDTTAALPKA